MDIIKDNNVETIRELIRLGQQSRGVSTVSSPLYGNHSHPFIIIKEGEQVQSLQQLIPNIPDRIRTTVEMDNITSFITYLKDFKTVNTRIFYSATENAHKFTALIDYHGANGPSWITHKCILTLTQTPEWSKWITHSENPFSQLQFAMFIEDNINEIIAPDGATMLELALTLEANQDVKYRGKQNLNNGDTLLLSDVSTELKAGKDGNITIPQELLLKVIPFKGMSPVELKARFRTFLRNGQMSLGYQLIRPHVIIDSVITSAGISINKETGIQIFSGIVR